MIRSAFCFAAICVFISAPLSIAARHYPALVLNNPLFYCCEFLFPSKLEAEITHN